MADVKTETIRVVIVDDVPSTVDSLTKLLRFEPDMEVVGTATSAAQAIELVSEVEPDVVLMDVNMPGQDGIRATETMSREAPHPAIVLMSVQEDREYLRRAMQAGAREFLVKPFSADEMAAALRRVHRLEKVKREAIAAPPPPEAPVEIRRGRGRGRVTVVFSGKGGVGKSMLAANLAAAFIKLGVDRVALVDFDLQFGDLGVLLGLESGRNVYQVVEAFPNIDAEFIEALMPGAPGGFKVLLGPQSPEFADLVTPEHARSILEILQGSFEHVVVDTSSHLGEVALEVLERADDVVLIVELSLPAVKEAKLALRVFDRLGMPSKKIRLLLNRADSTSGVTAAQVESNLGVSISGRMPSDGKLVVRSVQRAEPFVALFPESEISHSVRDFAISLLPSHAAEGAPGGRQIRKPFWVR